jgi:peroxiredoxin
VLNLSSIGGRRLWCSVCQQEAPALVVAAQQFTPSGVRFVGVDVADNLASARADMQHHGLRYPSLSDPGDLIATEFNRLIPIAALPSTLVISPDGRIAGRVIGAASDYDLRRLIKEARSHDQWFSRACAIRRLPLLLPALSAGPPSTSSKIIPCISRTGCSGSWTVT